MKPIASRKRLFYALISLCYPLLLFIKFYSPLDVIANFASPLMIMLGLLVITNSLNAIHDKFSWEAIVFIFYLLTTGLSIFYSDNLTFPKYILFVSYIGIGYAISRLKVKPVLAALPLLVVCIGILRSIYDNVQLELIFSVSQNFISIIMLVCLGIYFINQKNINSSISLPVLFLPYPFVFLAAGRSGIIAFLILLFLKIATLKKYILYFIAAFIPLLIYFFNSDSLYFLSESLFSRFHLMSGEDEPRLGVLLSYTERLQNSFYDLLFGVDLRGLDVVNELEGNPHNSFISLHSYFGLVPMLFVVYFALSSSTKLFLSKEFPLLLLLISIIVRSSTDIALFYGALDPIFFAIYFTVINKKEK